MEENLLQAIIQGVGVGGTIVLVVYLLRPVFIEWLKNIAAARELEARRIEAERESERELAQALNGVKTELSLSRGINNQLIGKMDTLPTRDDIQRAGNAMNAWGEDHNRRLDRVHADVKVIPDEMWRIGDPKLETLRQEIENRVTTLQAALEARIDPSAENARRVIREEFTAINKRLSEIDATLQRFSPPPPTTPFSAIPGRKHDKDDDTSEDAADTA